MADLAGTIVYDQYGAWTLRCNGGVWSAIQGDCEVLILDQRDRDRFGIEHTLAGVAA